MMKKAVLVTCVALLFAVEIGLLLAVQPVVTTIGLHILNQFPRSGGPPIPVESANMSGSGPGSLVSATTMPGVTRTFEGGDLQAARVLYRSTSGDTGQPTVVSGSVFTPKGSPPDGGWPVISLGHATVGIEGPCAPSLSPELFGFLIYVRVLTKLGYAVALADFQGLGTKGVHPYSDSRTAGLNMIDAVRALRHTFPNVSDRWAAVGDSQGGGAAWAADEQAQTYAPELHLVGAAAASPVSDLSGMVDKAQQGTLTKEQRPAIQSIIESLARLHPDLNRDDYRRGAAAHYWNVLSDCSRDDAYRRSSASEQLGASDFTPRTPQAADRLRELLQQWALPQRPLSAPLYVWYGGKDPYIDAEWTTAALKRACAMGGVMTIQFDPNRGHNPADALHLIDWIADRFKGEPVKNDC
jgi:pimeloyl-ACP methyl ester carboxylesterase